MKPYYQDDWVTIYHSDSNKAEFLQREYDLLLTDPPYGVDGGSGTIGLARAHKHRYSQVEDTPEYVKHQCVSIFEYFRNKSKASILTPGPKTLTFYAPPDSFGCFYQPASVGMQKWGRADSQPIFYYGKDPRSGLTIQSCSFVLTEHAEKNGHPCPKPLGIWKKLLDKGCLEGGTVIDPFMGSGTTLRAAKDLRRKAIGIEIDEKYCEIAAKRMSQEVLL